MQTTATAYSTSLFILPDIQTANTGKKAGACALLEQKLQHNVLYFPCRHGVDQWRSL